MTKEEWDELVEWMRSEEVQKVVEKYVEQEDEDE